MAESRVLVGMDPGGTTGIAWCCRTDEDAPWDWGTTYQITDCDTETGLTSLFNTLNMICSHAGASYHELDGLVTIVYESFDFCMDERNRTKIDYTAPQVIGALRYWNLSRAGVKLVRQNASTGKGFWTDAKIKRVGMWVPGRRHAMDAMRHLLWYRAFVLDQQELFAPFRPKS